MNLQALHLRVNDPRHPLFRLTLMVLGGFALTACVLGGGCSWALWSVMHDEVQRINSPNRSADAVVHEVNTGATDDYATWVYLVPHGQRIWPSSEPALIFQGSPGEGHWKGLRFAIEGRSSASPRSHGRVHIGTKDYEAVRKAFPTP